MKHTKAHTKDKSILTRIEGLSYRQKITLGIILIAASILGSGVFYAYKHGFLGLGAVTPTATITNQATVAYCTEGTTVCTTTTSNTVTTTVATPDPATGPTPAVTVSPVATAVATPAPGTSPTPAITTSPVVTAKVCVKVLLEKPKATTRIRVDIRREDGSSLAIARATYSAAGVEFTDTTFVDPISQEIAIKPSTNFIVHVKADEHLARILRGNPLSGCLEHATKLYWGDLRGTLGTAGTDIIGDNQISAAEVVDVIRGRIQQPTNFSSSDIVTLIRNRTRNAIGE